MNFAAAEFFRFFDCMTAVYREAIAQKNKNKNINKINNDNENNDSVGAEEKDSQNDDDTATVADAEPSTENVVNPTSGDAASKLTLEIPAPLKERLVFTGAALIENRKEIADWPPRIGNDGREPISIAADLIDRENEKKLKEKLKKITEVEILHRVHTFDLTGTLFIKI